jgi:hypothetical protein
VSGWGAALPATGGGYAFRSVQLAHPAHEAALGARDTVARQQPARVRWLPRSARSALPWAALAALLTAGAVVFLTVTRGTTLSFDEWSWALHRRGSSLETFLSPHNGHFSLLPVLVYKLLFATAGLGDYAPYRVVVIGLHLLCVALIFVYARRRVSGLLALIAAALVLFLIPAWQNFLWPFQVAWLMSISAGLGALLLLDRGDRLGQVTAGLLVACSLASSGVGLPVTIGLAVEILLRGDRWRRAPIVTVPLAAYAVWWVIYQNSSTTFHAVVRTPVFVAKLASATAAAMTGLAGHTVPFGSGTLLRYGPAVAVIGLLAFAWAVRRPGRLSPRVLGLVAITLSFWILAGLGRAGLAQPYDSRYLYVGAVFIVLLAVELGRGASLSAPAAAVALIVLGAVLASNLSLLHDVRAFERSQSETTAADLGALDIGRPLVAPTYVPVAFPGFGLRFTASSYYAMAKAIGSPAASPRQIASSPEGVRRVADSELIAIHRIGLRQTAARPVAGPTPAVDRAVGGSVTARAGCVVFAPSAGSPATEHQLQIALPAGGAWISVRNGPASVGVRRFASAFQNVGALASARPAVLGIAPDRSSVSWHARIVTTGLATVCGLP